MDICKLSLRIMLINWSEGKENAAGCHSKFKKMRLLIDDLLAFSKLGRKGGPLKVSTWFR